MISYDSSRRGSRREFLKRFSFGAAGIAAVPLAVTGCAGKVRHTPALHRSSHMEAPPATVAVMRGTDRRQLIIDVIKPFENELKRAIGDRQVIIKLNCNRPDDQLIKTHPDTIRGILDVITPWYDRTVLVGESTALEVPSEVTFSPRWSTVARIPLWFKALIASIASSRVSPATKRRLIRRERVNRMMKSWRVVLRERCKSRLLESDIQSSLGSFPHNYVRIDGYSSLYHKRLRQR